MNDVLYWWTSFIMSKIKTPVPVTDTFRFLQRIDWFLWRIKQFFAKPLLCCSTTVCKFDATAVFRYMLFANMYFVFANKYLVFDNVVCTDTALNSQISLLIGNISWHGWSLSVYGKEKGKRRQVFWSVKTPWFVPPAPLSPVPSKMTLSCFCHEAIQ